MASSRYCRASRRRSGSTGRLLLGRRDPPPRRRSALLERTALSVACVTRAAGAPAGSGAAGSQRGRRRTGQRSAELGGGTAGTLGGAGLPPPQAGLPAPRRSPAAGAQWLAPEWSDRYGQSAQPAADWSAQRLIRRRRWAAPAASWAARPRSCPPWARQRARTDAAPCLTHPPPSGGKAVGTGSAALRPCH